MKLYVVMITKHNIHEPTWAFGKFCEQITEIKGKMHIFDSINTASFYPSFFARLIRDLNFFSAPGCNHCNRSIWYVFFLN